MGGWLRSAIGLYKSNMPDILCQKFVSSYFLDAASETATPSRVVGEKRRKKTTTTSFAAQDTETGIDVCKLSEKNFLRTLGMLSVLVVLA